MHLHQYSYDSGGKRPLSWDAAVAPRTRLHVIIAFAKLFVAFCGISVMSYGIALVASPIAAIVDVLRHRRKTALIEGSCVRVTSQQFPEIHALVTNVAERVGLKHEPEIYVAGLGELNASASKLGRSRQIILSSELISGAAKTQDPGVLEFVVAHEIAHLYFGHTGAFRAYLKYVHKRLSRLDEFTADRAAASLVADKMSCTRAIALLTVGPDLIARVDLNSLLRQASWVPRNKHTFKAEHRETHPLLLHRLAKLTEFFDEEFEGKATENERLHKARIAA